MWAMRKRISGRPLTLSMEEKPMKCVKNIVNQRIRRVSNEKAREMVARKLSVWRYCPKSEWKAGGRLR
jgi:hypothetical protein